MNVSDHNGVVKRLSSWVTLLLLIHAEIHKN